MQRTIAAILLIAVLAIGGGLIATTAYQAGLSTAITTAVSNGGTVVAPLPAYGYGYGYGWHPGGFGFGFFGFLGTLLFIFIVFGLLRAVFFRGGRRGWGPGWGGGPGAWGPNDHDHDRSGGRNFWESRFGESFDEWHRKAHDAESSKEPPASNTGLKPD
jgi:hypothetical protein